MFTTLINAFKLKETRSKILFTLAMLVVIRFGSHLQVPGTNPDAFQELFDLLKEEQGALLGLLNVFTGGSLLNFSVFALGISPYITSSIIVQLLTIAIPKLEEMQQDGEDGRKKIAAISRYVTVALALLQATAMAIGFRNQGLIVNYSVFNVITVVAALTAGSAFLMWLGERITEKGVGNGISVILVINILATIPSDFTNLYTGFIKGKEPAMAILAAVIILAIIFAMIVFVVLLNSGTRNIAVQYSQKVQGRKSVGGQSSKIPMKVNTAGVVPVIFASSLLQFPLIICTFFNIQGKGIWYEVMQALNSGNWCKFDSLANAKYSIGLLVYMVLVVAFAYFYTSVTFNPMMIADNLKRQGGFIPGIRPGKPTTEYLNKVLNRIVFIGAVGLLIVSVVPFICTGSFGAAASVSFAGTSLIILVSVVLETITQVESQMRVRNYKGFLND